MSHQKTNKKLIRWHIMCKIQKSSVILASMLLHRFNEYDICALREKEGKNHCGMKLKCRWGSWSISRSSINNNHLILKEWSALMPNVTVNFKFHFPFIKMTRRTIKITRWKRNFIGEQASEWMINEWLEIWHITLFKSNFAAWNHKF